jgi:uncharacterized protein
MEEIVRGLIVPGLNGSGPVHWQTLWGRQYGFERVEQKDWTNPDSVSWVKTLDAAIHSRPDKLVVIAHSLGCWAVMKWVALHPDREDRVQAALLVAPPDLTSPTALPRSVLDFALFQKKMLPFPSILVGSENDPYMTLDKAQTLACEIGSRFVNAGFVGHINVDSGHGKWPQGEALLKQLI